MTPTLFALLAQGPPGNPFAVVFVLVLVAIALGALVATILLAKYFNIWIQAKMIGVPVSLSELVGMSARKVNPNIIVRSRIMAFQSGLTERDGVTLRSLEDHYLAGGDVPKVIRALVAARQAEIPLTFEHAAAIDLDGRDVLEEVQTSINQD